MYPSNSGSITSTVHGQKCFPTNRYFRSGRVIPLLAIRGEFRVTELRHKFRKLSLTSAHVILLHYAEVNIPMELGAEVHRLVPKLFRAEHRLPRRIHLYFQPCSENRKTFLSMSV